MPIKPLDPNGERLQVTIPVNHSNTNLIALDQGTFYTVETLLLDPITGVPYLPLVDYMFFQFDKETSMASQKETAAIIQIRNPRITSFVFDGLLSHGVEQAQIDYWKTLTTTKKNVPGWMNWVGLIDAELDHTQHQNLFKYQNKDFSEYTFSEVMMQMDELANQYANGGGGVLDHILNWQVKIFDIVQKRHDAWVSAMNKLIADMKLDTSKKVGDWLFTDNVKNSIGYYELGTNKHQAIWLKDRANNALITYDRVPHGGAMPTRLTELHMFTNKPMTIVGSITASKTTAKEGETVRVTVNISTHTNPEVNRPTLEMIDTEPGTDSELIGTHAFTSWTNSTGTWAFDVKCTTANSRRLKPGKMIVRMPEFMMIPHVVINVEPDETAIEGYLTYNIYSKSGGHVAQGGLIGYSDAVMLRVDTIGNLKNPKQVYVHLSGDYPEAALDASTPKFQQYTITNTNKFDGEVAKFNRIQNDPINFFVQVDVSTSPDPLDRTAITATALYYVKSMPVDPFISWFYTSDSQGKNRISTIKEGNPAFLIGKLSYSLTELPVNPVLTQPPAEPNSAIEGIDYNITKTYTKIDEYTIRYDIGIPLNEAMSTPYKSIRYRSSNSNTALMWIEDVSAEGNLVGSWHQSASPSAPIKEYMTETDKAYLHLRSNLYADGTTADIIVESPTIYGTNLVYPKKVTFFGRLATAEFKLDAPQIANPEQLLKVKVMAPGKEYQVQPLRILDTSKPYYEIRFLVDGIENITAYEGQRIQAQVRAIADPSANVQATLTLGGTADYSTGPNSDFKFPSGSGAIIKSWTVNYRQWTDVTIDQLFIRDVLANPHKTFTLGVRFGTNPFPGGLDTSLTLNIRQRYP